MVSLAEWRKSVLECGLDWLTAPLPLPLPRLTAPLPLPLPIHDQWILFEVFSMETGVVGQYFYPVVVCFVRVPRY
jgi:hypothetical protein